MSALLALMMMAAPVPAGCSLRHASACGGMYELATTPGFKRAVQTFVGPARVAWYERSRAADQLLMAYYGASSDPTQVRSDLLQFDACFPHNCSINGALYVNANGQIEGAALLYGDCTGEECRDGRKLVILKDPRFPDVVNLARKWGEAKEASWNAGLSLPPSPLSAIEVLDVPIRASKR